MTSSEDPRGSKERRQDILVAAERVFARRGIETATMDDVAREANISKGGLYRHFPSKNDLFFTVATSATRHFEGRVQLVVQKANGSSGFDAVRAYVAECVTYAKDESERFSLTAAVMSLDAPTNGESPLFREYQLAVGGLFQVVVAALTRGQKDGTVRPDVTAERLAITIWGALLGILQLDQSAEQFRRRAVPFGGTENLAVDFVDLFLASIRPGAVPVAPGTSSS